MEFNRAKRILLDFLAQRGKAKNSEMLGLIGNDAELFQKVREDLLFNDQAEDKKGAGLIFIGSKDAESVDHRFRIFISYGRADAEDLAFRMAEDLTRKGHFVWIDKRKIQSGASWEEQIEKAILEQDIFIALLTPHAVRRPDGVCLDEISMARYNNRKIIPIMVVQCRPPLGIYRLDWIDFQNWRNRERYRSGIRRIEDAMKGRQSSEGVNARLFSVLKPLDFGLEVSRLCRHFTGRQWMLDALDDWFSNTDERVFLITGDPGAGKSAIIARLVHQNPHVAAYHFCQSSLADSLHPVRFVRSVAAQMATQLDVYRSALETTDLEQLADADAGTLFRRLVADPLRGQKADRQWFILVDGLDESLAHGGGNIAGLLCDRVDDLPPWLRIVVSTRKKPEILDMFSPWRPCEIDPAQGGNLKDVALHIAERFQESALKKLLSEKDCDSNALASAIYQKSAGNFLYVVKSIEGILSGLIDPKNPEAFPNGLIGIYRNFFERIFPGGRGYEKCRSLLSVIAAARSPLSLAQLSAFAGEDPFDIALELQKIAPFFPNRNDCYSGFHKSIVDWLCGVAGHSLAYRVDARKGHRRIAAKLLSDWREGQFDYFLLQHLPAHLGGAEDWDALETVLTDLSFVNQKCTAGLLPELLGDYAAALENLPEGREAAEKERQRALCLIEYANRIIRRSSDKAQPFQAIPSVRPWGQRRLSQEIDRIRTAPSRLDRVRAFSQFVNSESGGLSKCSGFRDYCAQQAHNFGSDGPVFDAAAPWLSSAPGAESILLLKLPSFHAFFNPFPPLLKVLEGHKDQIIDIAASADGQTVASISSDKTLRIWDVKSGQSTGVMAMVDHSGAVFTQIALSADGRHAVSTHLRGVLRFWDVLKKQCLWKIKAHSNGVLCVAFYADGKRIMSAGADQAMRTWDVDSCQCVHEIKGMQHKIRAVDISKNGRVGLTWREDGVLALWDVASGKLLKTMTTDASWGGSVAIDATGETAISGCWGGKLRVWDLKSGQCVRQISTPSSTLALSDDGRIAASKSNRTVKVWDAWTGACLRTYDGHSDLVVALAVSTDGKHVVSGSWDGTVRVWDVEKGCDLKESGHKGPVSGVALSKDGRVAASCGADKLIRVWHVDKGKCLYRLRGHKNSATCVALSASGRIIVSGGKDQMLCVWDIKTGEMVTQMQEGRADWVSAVAVSEDGETAVSVSSRNVKVWDLGNGQCVNEMRGCYIGAKPTLDPTVGIDGHSGKIRAIALSSNVKVAVTGGYDQLLKIWDITNGRCLRTLSGHMHRIFSVGLSDDAKTLMSAGEDGVRLWKLNDDFSLEHVYAIHGLETRAAAITRDGRLIISWGEDHFFRLWDQEARKCVAMSKYPNAVSSLAIAADRMIAADVSGNVTVYHIKNLSTGSLP